MSSLDERFLKVKKDILEHEYSKLNKMQREAVFRVKGPLLILAGAGSGKTTVLVNKIAFNLKYGDSYYCSYVPQELGDFDIMFMENYIQYPDKDFDDRLKELMSFNPARPYEVLAITFTNKAANELKERLNKVIGPQAADIWAGTFHSICVRILRRHIEKIGYSSDFTIYDTDDVKKLIKDCLKALNLNEKNYPVGAVMSVISKAKDSMTAPELFLKQNGFDQRLEKIGKVYAEYQKRLKSANAVDFDDLLCLTVQLLRDNEAVREHYQEQFKYTYVDEYQDTNNVQYMLVSLLAAKHRNLTVVGDDDQSIYKFRGATIENILNFENQYQEAKIIRLEQNYRSTGIILDSANAAIKNNLGRKGKTLWTENGEGEKIKKYVAENQYDEGVFIANEVLNQIRVNNRSYHDFAVLYRTNSQSSAIEEAMLKCGVPYKIVAGMKFYDRKEIKDAISYLTVLTNPLDNLRLKRIINEPKRGIGESTLETAQRLADNENISIYQLLQKVSDYPDLDRAAKNITKFMDMMEQLKKEEEGTTPEEFVRIVLTKTGYLSLCSEQDKADGRDRLSNLEVLVSNIENYASKAENPSITGFLQEVSLSSELDLLSENGEYVSMMTIHSAKGLEFPVVFLTGMEEGLFPSMRSLSETSEIEEERRLAYVAITRAKEQLYVTRAAQRGGYYGTGFHTESRFLKEIPDKNIDDLSAPKAAPVMRKEMSDFAVVSPKPAQSVYVERAVAAPSHTEFSIDYQAGDIVIHSTFGQGTVISIKQMAGDAMVEVAFDTVGTKKLMANFAKLKKANNS
ncbi:MAG: 3'-5' exonuclease [Bacillota bacterium]|nr:3'-5' exonuclease [Bacillota bacterium]